MTSPTTTVLRSLDVPLGPGGRTLRLTLALDERGEPASLVLAQGFGGADSGRDFHRPGWLDHPLHLPASVLPQLVAALTTLSSEAEP